LVARLALDVPERRLGRQRGYTRERTIAGVDLIRAGPRDHEIRHTLADLGPPDRVSVQTRRDLRSRRVVPDQAVPFVRHEEADATRLPGGCIVGVLALQSPAAIVEDSLLVLAETVVVLVLGCDERRTDLKGLLAIHLVRTHFPAAHRKKRRPAC